MNDFASLGVGVKRDGSVAATNAELEKFSAIAQRAEVAAGKLYNAKFNKEARDYAASVTQATRSLTGFDAIAARAAQQAKHVSDQMSRLTMSDLRADDIAAYGREMDQLRAKFNPLFAASKQYEASLDEINYAHRVGAISAQEQQAAIMRLDAQYEMAAQSANKLTMANKSMAGSFHTTNLLFQAQDIAMMSMMGQAPLMLALQQGTQVGGIFHQIGNGRQIVQALGGAVMGLLNPINLATIAAIGLGAAGVQAFMSWVQSAAPAKRTMEDHRAWLDNILRGYDDLNSQVTEYLDKATRMPQSLARLEVTRGLNEDLARLQAVQDEMANISLRNLPRGPADEGLAILRDLRGQLDAGQVSAEAFAQKMTLITMNDSVSANVRALAQRLLESALEAAELEARIDGSRQALAGLTDEAGRAAAQMALLSGTFSMLDAGAGQNGGLQNVLDKGTDALDTLRRMVPEIRDTKAIASDLVSTVMDSLPTQAARDEAQALFDTILKNDAILTARREASKAGSKRDPYADLTRGAHEFIAAQQLEQQALGMTTEAAARMRYEQDLLNKAANDNISLTPVMRDELTGLAAQMASVEEATRRVTEIYSFGKDVFTGFFGDLKSGLKEGQSLWESLGNAGADALDKIADRALSMAANGIFDMIFGSIMSGITGGWGGNPLSLGAGGAGFLGGGASAWGSFDGGGFTGYGSRSGGMDGKGGFPALLHPNETVIDHTRGQVANSNAGGGGDIIINNVINVPAGTSPETAPAIAREVTKELRRQLPEAIQSYNRNPLRRAG